MNFKSLLTNDVMVHRIATSEEDFGAIAQLGERLHGMQEVAGSIPASSSSLFYIDTL